MFETGISSKIIQQLLIALESRKLGCTNKNHGLLAFILLNHLDEDS
jgi:hypothetical protein